MTDDLKFAVRDAKEAKEAKAGQVPAVTSKEGNDKELKSGGIKIKAFKKFREQFSRQMSSPHFGGTMFEVDQYSKTPGAKELERTGARSILGKVDFLHRAHQVLQEYARLSSEQKKVWQESAQLGKSIKRLRDAQKTLKHLQQEIKDLDERLAKILSLECRGHFDKALKELRFVENALFSEETTQASNIHPELRRKHDKADSEGLAYTTSFRSLLPRFNYRLGSLKKKAPQQWLIKRLDSELRSRFQQSTIKVSDITRYRIISTVLVSGGLQPILPLSIKEYLVGKTRHKEH